jgi:hypothetical protein
MPPEAMPPETANLTETIERELSLLRELAGELIACRTAFTGMDIDAIYAHIGKQAKLCEKLQLVGRERATAWQGEFAGWKLPLGDRDLRSWLESLDPAIGRRMRELLTELALAEGEVRNLNRVHTLFLDGSRRTLNIMANALATFLPTYAQPAASKAMTGTGPETRQ